MSNSAIVKELRKADLKAKEYARGPAGLRPFVISIQERKDSPGLFRTWTGAAEIEVHPNRRAKQAVITANELERDITRDVKLSSWDRIEPVQTDRTNQDALSNFPVALGANERNAKWDYGEMHSVKKVNIRGAKSSDYRWDFRIPVTATVPASGQSLLVGMDETHYFVCALPETATSVRHAHEMLRPSTAHRKGVVRQGEWFFIPVNNEKLATALLTRIGDVRFERLEFGSTHMTNILTHGNSRYAIGVVQDARKGRHEPLLLNRFHQIVRNKEVTVLTPVPQRHWD